MNDTTFAIIFIAVAILGIFIFWKVVKNMFNLLKKFLPAKNSSDKFVDKQNAPFLSNNFDQIVQNLEREREVLHSKTEGLFKRAFFRSWFFLGSVSLLLSLGLNTEGELMPKIIGPLLMTGILSLLGAGIYTLIKKGTNNYNFSRVLKKELVSKIVTFVNPELTFFDKGITDQEFYSADIFNKGNFTSEDTIEGTIEGNKISISECNLYSHRQLTNDSATIQYKNVKINSGSKMSTGTSSHLLFYGLFIQLGLQHINSPAPLKFTPVKKNILEEKFNIKISRDSYTPSLKQLKPKEKIEVDAALRNEKYNIYCSSNSGALSILSPKLIKVIDFIYHKFEGNDVFVTINNTTLSLALSWNQDMFETDAFLKTNLVESGIAEKFHKDLLFINQIIKEVNLINKI